MSLHAEPLTDVGIESPTLLLIPGLGADGRFFQPQQSLPIPFEVANWIEPESMGESLRHYASRMADAIGARPNLYVGGISMGAMVALEVATAVGAKGVIVIGGCWSHRQISPFFRTILTAGAIMPSSWIRPSLSIGPLVLKLLEGLNPEQSMLMVRMLREHNLATLQWSCRALLNWECCKTFPQMAIHTIHGSDDRVIPAKKVHADVWVPGGRHLISLTHPIEVNNFIVECINRRSQDSIDR